MHLLSGAKFWTNKFLKKKKCKNDLKPIKQTNIESAVGEEEANNQRRQSSNGIKEIDYDRNVLNNGPSGKILYILYANDCVQSICNLDRSPPDTVFEIKLINVDTSEQLRMLNSQESINVNNNQLPSSPALFCILLSAKMTNIINNDSGQHFGRINNDETPAAGGTAAACTIVLYDEFNEINMFRIKYKMANCTFAKMKDGYGDLANIVLKATQLNNEEVYRVTGGYNSTASKAMALYKIFPKKIFEGNGKVLILFDDPQRPFQFDVLLNGKSTLGRLQLKWRNQFTLSIVVPDELMAENSLLNIGLIRDGVECLGSRTMKCERQCSDWKKLLQSVNSVQFICQSFGVRSVEQLDSQLSSVYGEEQPDMALFEHLLRSGKDDFWLPTWIHFAAAYGLKQLMCHLLKSPAAAKACRVQNSRSQNPIAIAMERGHHEIVDILKCFTEQFQQLKCDFNEAAKYRQAAVPEATTIEASSMFFDDSSDDESYYNLVSECKPTSGPITISNITTGDMIPENDNLIIEAKNRLLDIIEQFKCGISIKSFEQLFRQWERNYELVLKDQMSNEFLYSLGEIRKLCNLGHHDGHVHEEVQPQQQPQDTVVQADSINLTLNKEKQQGGSSGGCQSMVATLPYDQCSTVCNCFQQKAHNSEFVPLRAALDEGHSDQLFTHHPDAIQENKFLLSEPVSVNPPLKWMLNEENGRLIGQLGSMISWNGAQPKPPKPLPRKCPETAPHELANHQSANTSGRESNRRWARVFRGGRNGSSCSDYYLIPKSVAVPVQSAANRLHYRFLPPNN